jgi:hypothetical protein
VTGKTAFSRFAEDKSSPGHFPFLARFFDELMYLLYVDESGNPDGEEDKHFVLGGIAVFERQAYWINNAVDTLQQDLFPDAQVEFHAQAITAHKEEPWHSLPSKRRTETLQELCQIIAGARAAALFGIVVERAMTPEPFAKAFEELCNRFDLFLKRLYAQGDKQRGLIIFDETRYESRIQTLLSEYRRTGTRFGKVHNFADVPFCADSRSTRLLQLADLVAYAVFRRYERSHTWLFDQLINSFDTENGTIHGLVHLPNRTSCACPSCLSRRLTGHASRALVANPETNVFE